MARLTTARGVYLCMYKPMRPYALSLRFLVNLWMVYMHAIRFRPVLSLQRSQLSTQDGIARIKGPTTDKYT